MKQFKVSKDILNYTMGLSCIENYMLYVMIAERYPYPYLYYRSYRSLSNIITDFIIGNNYPTDCLSLVMSDNHLVRIQRYEKSNFNSFVFHDFNCVMVRPEYMIEQYGCHFLNNSHYILLAPGMDTDNYAYVNDIPKDIGTVTISKLKDISAGKIFCFDIQKYPDEKQKKKFFRYLYNTIRSRNELQADLTKVDIAMAKNSLGIYKIMSKRLIDFCSLYMPMDFYQQHLKRIERGYMILKYMCLLGEKDLHRIHTLLEQLCRENNRYLTVLESEMKKFL